MIRKKSAMATARRSGKRNLELFASTGILRSEAKKEVEEWYREALDKRQAAIALPQTKYESLSSLREYQDIRLLRDYIEANIK